MVPVSRRARTANTYFRAVAGHGFHGGALDGLRRYYE
jgi:hypothetical protein